MSVETQTIPDDIVAKVGDLCKALGIASTPANCVPIIQAIHAERKRCAAVAKHATMATGAPLDRMGDEVAEAVLDTPKALKFWMVYGVGTRSPTFQHCSKADAQAEAKRLAALNPDVLFVVLAAVDGYATEIPAVQRFKIIKDKPIGGRDADDDIPF